MQNQINRCYSYFCFAKNKNNNNKKNIYFQAADSKQAACQKHFWCFQRRSVSFLVTSQDETEAASFFVQTDVDCLGNDPWGAVWSCRSHMETQDGKRSQMVRSAAQQAKMLQETLPRRESLILLVGILTADTAKVSGSGSGPDLPVGGSSYSTSSRTLSPTFFSRLMISSCRSLVRLMPFTDLM